jgi:hypothetical protein
VISPSGRAPRCRDQRQRRQQHQRDDQQRPQRADPVPEEPHDGWAGEERGVPDRGDDADPCRRPVFADLTCSDQPRQAFERFWQWNEQYALLFNLQFDVKTATVDGIPELTPYPSDKPGTAATVTAGIARSIRKNDDSPDVRAARERMMDIDLPKLGRAAHGLKKLAQNFRESDLPRVPAVVVTADRKPGAAMRLAHQRLAAAAMTCRLARRSTSQPDPVSPGLQRGLDVRPEHLAVRGAATDSECIAFGHTVRVIPWAAVEHAVVERAVDELAVDGVAVLLGR